MHYLEDYLELLEPFQEEIREKLILIRENDIKLQVEHAQLEEDASAFLHNYHLYRKQSSLSPTKSKINVYQQSTPSVSNQPSQLTPEQLAAQQEKQAEYDKLVQRHGQLMTMTTEKILLANESHEFVERYFKKLENDLHKFKMELEADYAGLTEKLEQRFANEMCNEYKERINENTILNPSLLDMEPLYDPFDDLALTNSLTDDHANQPTFNCLPSQSRRLSTGLNSSHSLVSLHRKQYPHLHSNTPTSSARGRKRLQGTPTTNHCHKRKQNGIRKSLLNDSQYLQPSDSDESLFNTNLPNNDYFHSNFFDDKIDGDFDAENILSSLNEPTGDTIDERRYCFCNRMSYGDMIACDNPTCLREWFHYPCVGIITPPKGKWFCIECNQLLKEQQSQLLITKRG